MAHLFQSPFLQSLGYAIANSLWQMAILWLVYTSISGIASLGAAAKYRLAVAAQMLGFAWFIVTFRFYFGQYSIALESAAAHPQNVQAILAAGDGALTRTIHWMVRGEQLLPYVSAAYLLLIALLCIRWLMGYRGTQRIRRMGLEKMPVEWKLFVERIAGQLNISRNIQIFLSDHVRTPLTIGFFKPVILIPVASINHLTTQQLEAVLLHELAHIKRFDYLVNILLSIVEITLFFNPFTQLLSKTIRKERENCCDDWVLQFQYDASVYAEALLRIAYLQQSAETFAMAATGRKNELLVRVKRMIGEKENTFNYRKQLLAFAVVTGILTSIAWINPAMHKMDRTATQTGKLPAVTYAVEPMAVSVDNPLFNPVFFLSRPLKDEMQKNIEFAQKGIDEAMIRIPDLKDLPYQTIESVTPLVADAMERASIALDQSGFANEEARSEIAKAKKEFNKHFFDSLFTPAFNLDLKNNLSYSMKAAQEGLNKAKVEIARAFDEKNFKTDVNTEISSLVNDLNALGQPFLQKIILNSLDITGATLNGLFKDGKDKSAAAKSKAKSTGAKQQEPQEEQDKKDVRLDLSSGESSTENDPSEGIPSTESGYQAGIKEIGPDFFTRLASWTSFQEKLAADSNETFNAQTLAQLKKALLQLAKEERAKAKERKM